MTDPAGSVFTYSYDSGGNLKTVTYPDAGGNLTVLI
jgi:YD repeat-containing protein